KRGHTVCHAGARIQGGDHSRVAPARIGRKSVGSESKTWRHGNRRSKYRRCSRAGVLAHVRPACLRAVHLSRSTHSFAVGSGHSTFATRVPFIVSTGIDI